MPVRGLVGGAAQARQFDEGLPALGPVTVERLGERTASGVGRGMRVVDRRRRAEDCARQPRDCAGAGEPVEQIGPEREAVLAAGLLETGIGGDAHMVFVADPKALERSLPCGVTQRSSR